MRSLMQNCNVVNEMENFILLADDDDVSRCDDCGRQADVLTGSGDFLCADCVNIRAGMEER